MIFTIILFLTLANESLSALDDIKVGYSNIDLKQEEHAIATFFYLIESETDLKVIVKKMVTEMDTKFGKSWFGQIGANNSSEFYIDLTTSTYITIAFKQSELTLYKIPVSNSTYNAGAHILEKINSARNSTYELIATYGTVNTTARTQNITKVIDIFRKNTETFASHSCLKVKENEMNRYSDRNCYEYLSIDIEEYLGIPVVICETAYCAVDYYTTNTTVYEFYLGPLFFAVFPKIC